jgi:hypothetical protein
VGQIFLPKKQFSPQNKKKSHGTKTPGTKNRRANLKSKWNKKIVNKGTNNYTFGNKNGCING